MAPGGSEVQLHVHLKVERCGVFHGHVCFPTFCKTCTHKQLYQHRPQMAYGVTLWCISVHLKTVSFAPNHGIQQWHSAVPSNITTSSPPKLVTTHGTQQWHPVTAHSNGTLLGTQQWHPIKSAKNGARPPSY